MLKATLIGNLGNDPDMRYSASGSPLLRFNVASNFRTRTPEGEFQDKTEWVRVTVTGNRAESLSQYLKKGSRVYVEGRLEARPWTDQQGQIRAGLEVLANEVQFMSSRADDEARASGGGGYGGGGGGYGGGGGGGGGDYGDRPAPRERTNNPPAQRSAPRSSAPEPMDDGDLEDLPF
jgi:single-strand DNA-binding protein